MKGTGDDIFAYAARLAFRGRISNKILQCHYQKQRLIHAAKFDTPNIGPEAPLSQVCLMEGTHEDRPLAEFRALRCNFLGQDNQPCTRSNEEDCWITSCGHMFCFEHAKVAFSCGDTCPVCKFVGARIVQSNLTRESRLKRKRGLLVGLSPSEIMDFVDGAIDFWVRQKALEAAQRLKRCSRLEQREKSIADSIEAQLEMTRKECQELESEQIELQQKINTADVEVSKLSSHLQRLRRDVQEAEEQYNGLRSQVFGLPLPKSSNDGYQRPSQTSAFSFQGATPAGARRASAHEQPGHSTPLATQGPATAVRVSAESSSRTSLLNSLFAASTRTSQASKLHPAPLRPMLTSEPQLGVRKSSQMLTPGFFANERLMKRRLG